MGDLSVKTITTGQIALDLGKWKLCLVLRERHKFVAQ